MRTRKLIRQHFEFDVNSGYVAMSKITAVSVTNICDKIVEIRRMIALFIDCTWMRDHCVMLIALMKYRMTNFLIDSIIDFAWISIPFQLEQITMQLLFVRWFPFGALHSIGIFDWNSHTENETLDKNSDLELKIIEYQCLHFANQLRRDALNLYWFQEINNQSLVLDDVFLIMDHTQKPQFLVNHSTTMYFGEIFSLFYPIN